MTHTHPFRIFISAGEVSGDLQGGLLIRALYAAAAARGWHLEIEAVGGAQMAVAGATLLADTTCIGAIGLLESLPYIRSVLSIQQHIRHHLKRSPPDLVVLIDYVGFNLSLAGYLKRIGAGPVIYYIAPQEWVWSFGKGTTRRIVERTDHIVAIFSQEAEYYAAHGAKVTWVGHPFIDALAHRPSRAEARQQLGIPPEQKAIALFPASRQQELQHIMPVLAAAAQHIQAVLPEVHFWIPAALDSFRAPLQQTIVRFGLKATLTTQPQLTLAAADLAIGKSGTANLEAALLNIPQIVVYRIHPINGWLYRTLLGFKVPFISPVNLIQQQAIVPELLQEAATPRAIAQLALALIQPSNARTQMLEQYQTLRAQLGSAGVIHRAADTILNHLPEIP